MNRAIAQVLLGLLILPLFLLTLGAAQPAERDEATGNDKPAELGKFVAEIMRMQVEGDRMHIALWLPHEFFVEAAMSETGASREATRGELEFLKPYTIIVVQRSETQPDGNDRYDAEQSVRGNASLTLPDGKKVRPMDNPPPTVADLASTMKAMMGKEGDAGGQNMHVLIFDSGEARVDASKKGKLTLSLGANGPHPASNDTWHMPLDALSPPVDCAKCGEEVSAKYNFCPWCGHKSK